MVRFAEFSTNSSRFDSIRFDSGFCTESSSKEKKKTGAPRDRVSVSERPTNRGSRVAKWKRESRDQFEFFWRERGRERGVAGACGNRLVKRRALYNAERSLGLRGEKWRENIKVGEYKLGGGRGVGGMLGIWS